jgi:membrane-bound ClpP family serine protease
VEIGEVGRAVTDCYPTGVAQFKGKRHDVTSEGELMKKGTFVVVTRLEGTRIFVEENRSGGADV